MYRPLNWQKSLQKLSPIEYVREEEDASARALIKQQQSKHTKWTVRDGFPELVSVDKDGIANYLRTQGHTNEEVDAYLTVITDPRFNEMNRRGIERLRARIVGCKKIAFRLWGSSEKPLESVPVGVAMIPYVNAGAHPVPEAGSAILMNFGLTYLYDFFNLFNKRQEDEIIPPSAIPNTDPLVRLARAIFGSSIDRREFVTAFPRSLNVSSDIKLQSRINMAMSFLYVLLHEYGHIALGHTEELRKWPDIDMLSDHERNKYCKIMRDWEYEADGFAYDVLRGRHGKTQAPIPPRAFLNLSVSQVFMVMGLAVGIDKKVEAASDTHPIPKKRAFRLFGVTSDQEFREKAVSIFKGKDSSDSDRFVDEMLTPLLEETGAIKTADK